MKFVSILVAFVALAFIILYIACPSQPVRILTYHSDPWDRRVFVISGTGVYHHKINGSQEPGTLVGGSNAMELLVNANTEHTWQANTANDLVLEIYLTMPPD